MKPNLPPARPGVLAGKGGATEEPAKTGSPVTPEEEGKVAVEE